MSNLTAAQDQSHLRYRESGHEVTNTKRQFRPQFCRSEDFNECLVLVNADLQAKFLGMTTNNDRYPCLSRHLTERLR
ncbi:hypothetical protein [Ruegeria arenilitoris]|uniref:hypothetical protein n=1 Tax=Ruegeria arenilitoris TaxID=1173585 RepID=UPI0014811B56|nr:hypothetical protein [Ruegeria arenilitoris]